MENGDVLQGGQGATAVLFLITSCSASCVCAAGGPYCNTERLKETRFQLERHQSLDHYSQVGDVKSSAVCILRDLKGKALSTQTPISCPSVVFHPSLLNSFTSLSGASGPCP